MHFVEKLWQQLKLTTCSADYVPNICDKYKTPNQDGNISFEVQKNNRLHQDTDFFSNYHDMLNGFGFLLALNLSQII